MNSAVGGNVDVGYFPTQDIQKGTTNYLRPGQTIPAGVE